jgi:hypothetical protein
MRMFSNHIRKLAEWESEELLYHPEVRKFIDVALNAITKNEFLDRYRMTHEYLCKVDNDQKVDVV